MAGYKTFTMDRIIAPRRAQTADVWINAGSFEPWISGTAQFANISVTTTPHSLLFRAGVIAAALIGICALIMLLVRFWRRSAPARQSSPMAPPAQYQPSTQTMNANINKSFWPWAVSAVVAVWLLALGLAMFHKSVKPIHGRAGDYQRLGDVRQTKGDWDGAIAAYTKAIELKPDDEDACRNRGDAKQGKNDWDGAIADYTKAIELKPDDEGAYRNRGDAKQRKRDWDGAITDYTKALELKPDDEDAYFNRSLAKKAKGNLEGASADHSKAIEMQPDLESH
jgi:tetratricopeptide (TPR) repeat protein